MPRKRQTRRREPSASASSNLLAADETYRAAAETEADAAEMSGMVGAAATEGAAAMTELLSVVPAALETTVSCPPPAPS
jgi:hypothetical protein